MNGLNPKCIRLGEHSHAVDPVKYWQTSCGRMLPDSITLYLYRGEPTCIECLRALTGMIPDPEVEHDDV